MGWFDIPEKTSLIALVDDVQQGEPYFNEPGEIPAKSWLQNSCRDTSLIFTAYHWPSVYPIGYCVMKPYESYPGLEHGSSEYGVDPKTCIYIAELGISEAVRGMGIGSMLLEFGMKQCPRETTHYLVRTMKRIFGKEGPNRAISFYRNKLGFEIVRNADGEEIIERIGLRPRLLLRKTVNQ